MRDTHLADEPIPATCDRAARRRRHIALAACLVAMGVALRVWRFDAPGLWTDEFISFWVVEDAGAAEIASRCFRYTPCPPLYFYVLKGSIALFGESEWAMRLPSVVFGSLLLIGAYFFVRRLFDSEIALLALAILALDGLLIFESHNARMYSLGLVAALACMASFVEILRHPRWPAYAAYFVAAAAMFYTHYLFCTVILFTNAAMFARRKRRHDAAAWAAVNGALAVAFLPGLAALMARRTGVLAGEPVYWINLLKLANAHLKLAWVGIAAVPAAAVELFRGDRQRATWALPLHHRESFCLTAGWYAMTALAVVAAGLTVDAILLWKRYSIVSTLAGGILVAACVAFVQPARTRRTIVAVLLAGMVCTRAAEVRRTGVFALREDRDFQRGWREALQEAGDAITPGDLVFVQGTVIEAMAPKGLILSDDPVLQRYLAAPAGSFYLKARPDVRALPKDWDRTVFERQYKARFARAIRTREAFWVACSHDAFYGELDGWIIDRSGLGVRRTAHAEHRGCHVARYERAGQVGANAL